VCDFGASSSDAVSHADGSGSVGCGPPPPQVQPQIAVAPPKIVMVRKNYLQNPHRLAVRVSTDVNFTGTATLNSTTPHDIEIYDSRGRLQNLPLQITGRNISGGVTYYIRGIQASAGVGTSQLQLSLTGGNKTIVNSPATDTFTCVEVTLDLCQYKAAPGGGDPAPVADKINTGRNVHLQTAGLWAGRAMIIVHQAQPAAYTGNVVLQSIGGGVRTFPYANEVPAGGDVASADPLSTANAALGGNLRLWVEGAAVSRAVLDTGFTLGISDLPGVVGDRANVTVVAPQLNIYGAPAHAGGQPPRIDGAAKLNPGRALHLQDVGHNFWRARAKVKRVRPSAWTGSLEVLVWDVTAAAYAMPRAALFTGPAAADPPYVNPVAHPAGVPRDGKVIWAEGSTTSGALRDTELHLRLADAEGYGDAAALTIHEFRVAAITFNGVKDIYYARIPNPGAANPAGSAPANASYLLLPAGDNPADHLTPVEVRPATGTPHWRRVAGPGTNPAAQFSWPAAYARRDAAGVPAPTLAADLELFPKVAGAVTAPIKAIGGPGGLVQAVEQNVTFNNGDALGVNFTLRVPNTVRRLDGIRFVWSFQGPAHETRHTLFIVDQQPRVANNGFTDEQLWEVFEWGCGWADGVKRPGNVFNRIWSRFHPAAAPPIHPCGLTYWKNHHVGINPAQDLPTAIQSRDDPSAMQQNAASCIVFDRVLMNCLSIHGIASAEVVLSVPGANFVRGGNTYTCQAWNDTTIIGQANVNSPPRWGNHWIASVNRSGWKFYDASYGEGPVNSPTPGNPPVGGAVAINVFRFEPRTVASFRCIPVPVAAAVNLARSGNAAVPPHLDGVVQWNNG
jgi:hypothetical protein